MSALDAEAIAVLADLRARESTDDQPHALAPLGWYLRWYQELHERGLIHRRSNGQFKCVTRLGLIALAAHETRHAQIAGDT